MTRASTLVLALLIITVLLGWLCLVVARGERKSDALRLWGLGMLVYAIGLLITLAGFLPFDLRKVLGNGLIAYAPVLSVDGALRHTRYRLRPGWVLAGLAASILPILINHLDGHYQVLVDFLSPAPIANVLFIVATVALLRDPPADARFAARFLAGIFIFSVLVWTLRIALIVTSVGGSNDRDRADLTIALFCIAQIVVGVSATLGLLWIEVRRMAAEFRHQADLDSLTGLPNRRSTMRQFDEATERSRREGRPLAFLLIDIDRFKRVNDRQGHLTGDAVLRHVAALLPNGSVNGAVAGRVGGEEFVCLLAAAGPTAIGIAEELRARIEASPLGLGASSVRVTVSGGLAFFPADGESWDQVFAVADRRLYTAKAAGRNRIISSEPERDLGISGPLLPARG